MFKAGQWPAWASGEAWAPEIHYVNGRYQVYFSMKKGVGDKSLALGVAISEGGPFGPYRDLGRPLLEHPDGVIDATFFKDPV